MVDIVVILCFSSGGREEGSLSPSYFDETELYCPVCFYFHLLLSLCSFVTDEWSLGYWRLWGAGNMLNYLWSLGL